MKFGVHCPSEGRDFETMKTFCQTAERLNYDLFTVTDHFTNMAKPTGPSNHPLECWSTLSGLAAVTDRIQLGPSVCCASYRHPALLAKIATTVDIISNGRLMLGIGAGWHELEFEHFFAKSPSLKERFDGLEDAIQICRGMFIEGKSTYLGKKYSTNEAFNFPKPIQKSIPIMVGGYGEKRTLKIAAEYADIVHFGGRLPAEEVPHKLDVLKSHCVSVGRKFSSIRIAKGISAILDEEKDNIKILSERMATRSQGKVSEAEARKFILRTTGPKNIANAIRAYQRLGVDTITLNGLSLEDLQPMKEQVLSQFDT